MTKESGTFPPKLPIKLAYSGNFVQVKETVIDGHTWEQAYFPDSLVVFPLTQDNEIIMIEEKRPHEKNPIRLKFVTGHVHPEDSNVLDTANREMMEEIGMRAGKLIEMMKHESSGTINSTFHFILAKDLEPFKIPNPDGEDTIVSIKKFSIGRLEEMILKHELEWTLSTLGIFKILALLKAGELDSAFMPKT